MRDEKHTPEVGAWLKDREVRPVDSEVTARRVAARLPQVRQRSRWWPFPVLYRESATSPATDPTEFQPGLMPATDGHTPTVTGRTRSMLSPAKAITAGAIVFALGGAFLITQPFGQQSSAPGAEADAGPAESSPFTMSFVWLDQPTQAGEEVADRGVNKTIGDCYAMGVAAPSDPRMDGAVTYCGSEHVYGEVKDDSTFVWTATYRIVNDEGAWQGSHTGAVWDDPSSSERMDEGGDFVILAGEGAYDGLYAAISLPWSDVRGVIFEGAPPVGPILPTAE